MVFLEIEPDGPASLNRPGHPGLTGAAASAASAPLAADQRFIHFDDPEQRGTAGEGVVAHGRADAVAEMPRCLIRSDAERPLQLVRRQALAGFAHQVDGGEPLSQRQMRLVHNSASRHAEVVAAAEAVPLAAPRDFGHVHVPAVGASHPVRPAEGFEVRTALVVTVEPVKQGNEIHESPQEESHAPQGH